MDETTEFKLHCCGKKKKKFKSDLLTDCWDWLFNDKNKKTKLPFSLMEVVLTILQYTKR